MMLEPLLSREAASGIDGCGRPGRALKQHLRILWSSAGGGWLRDWWRVTTDADFLQSGISRRPAWKILFPVVSLINPFFDSIAILQGEAKPWWLLADMPFALAGCGYAISSIGAESLLVDGLLIVSYTVVWGLSALYSYSAEGDVTKSDVDAFQCWIPAILVCIAFAGFHSLAVLWFWVMAMIGLLASSNVPVELQWQLVVSTGLICAGAVAMEYTIAKLYSQWQLQLRCNQRLLEGASDGFGTVRAVDGIVLAASPKMVETMGDRSLVGKSLQSGVLDARDIAALAAFFGMAQEGLSPSPVLVTWSSGDLECELRMVPYEMHDSMIGFCVQRVGEVRSRSMQVEQPPSATIASATSVTDAALARDKACHGQPPAPAAEAVAITVKGHDDRAASDDSCVQELSPAAGEGQDRSVWQPLARGSLSALQMLQQPARSRGTMSLSSWTISQEGTESHLHDPGQKPKKVETRTLGVQVDGIAATIKPPAPMTASSAPKPAQDAAQYRKHVKKVQKAVAVEGTPHLKRFAATPQLCCGNALRELVSHLNVGGKGCCAYHIVWRGMYRLLTEELYKPCSRSPALCRDWQCPECFALNDFGTFAALEEDEEEAEEGTSLKVCALCHELVPPMLHHNPDPLASHDGSMLSEIGNSDVESTPLVASQSGISSNASSSSEGTCATDF
mmetsp:Transcript_47482/g.112894  ORF Transcript_47482/g.112894 Transcript_47482/m.112894 type:complete len:677 (+) Transcript_47482:140-2170(+)